MYLSVRSSHVYEHTLFKTFTKTQFDQNVELKLFELIKFSF